MEEMSGGMSPYLQTRTTWKSKMPRRKSQTEILKFDVLKTNILSGNKSKNIQAIPTQLISVSSVSLSLSAASGSVVLMLFTV